MKKAKDRRVSLTGEKLAGLLKLAAAIVLFPAVFVIKLFADREKDPEKRFGAIYKGFRSGGLSRAESFFNALYIRTGERLEQSRIDVRGERGYFARHPLGEGREEIKTHESRFWRWFFDLLTKLPYRISKPLSGLRKTLSFRKSSATLVKRAAAWGRAARRAAVWLTPAALALALGLYMRAELTAPLRLGAQVNGVKLGAVSDVSQVTEAVSRVESKASDVLGAAFKFPHEIRFYFTDSARTVNESDLYPALMNSISEYITPGYGLYVDSVQVAATRSESEIEKALDQLTEEIKTNTAGAAKVEITNDLRILSGTYPTQSLTDGAHLKDLLLHGSSDYSNISLLESFVEEGRGCATAAQDFAASIGESALEKARTAALSAQAYSENIQRSVYTDAPLVKFAVTKDVFQEDVLPYPVEEVKDSKMYVGGRETRVAGKNGKAVYHKQITYVDGAVTEEKVVSYDILEEPSAAVVAVGTKPIPESTVPSGDLRVFILPRNDRINSGFGWRVLNGRNDFHAGLDIEAPMRSAIFASLSGEVVQAGSYYSYGNLVVIKHDNGFSTYYAHLDEIIVKVGDRVTQGQQVGYSGNTGYTTGPHFHFELRNPDGEAINPLPYIYSK